MNTTAVTAADDSYEGRFSRGNFTVGAEFADELGSEYGALRYYVIVRFATEDPSADAEPGDRVAYVTDRESFNSVELGEAARFRTADGEEPRITEFIAE